jgi:hypothetical protein
VPTETSAKAPANRTTKAKWRKLTRNIRVWWEPTK